MKNILIAAIAGALLGPALCLGETEAQFWATETDRRTTAAEAKNFTFFVRVVIGGDWGPETASYEVTYSGDRSDLDLARGADVTGEATRRDIHGEKHSEVGIYNLSHLIRDCINQELFELGPRKNRIEPPDVLKMDGCQLWVFIKFGDEQNSFGRSDDSLPLWQTYLNLKKLTEPNQTLLDNGDKSPRQS